MKHLNFLTCAASITLSAFLLALCFGLVSMPVFMISAMIWISLLTVYSYSPRTHNWLPRRATVRIAGTAGEHKSALPLAA